MTTYFKYNICFSKARMKTPGHKTENHLCQTEYLVVSLYTAALDV